MAGKLSDQKQSCSVKDLQSLVGSLSHLSKVVHPGMTLIFLEDWNGISMIVNPEEGKPDVEMYTDALDSFEYRAWTGDWWLQLQHMYLSGRLHKIDSDNQVVVDVIHPKRMS